MRLVLLLGLACACSERYLHVTVEGADLELTVAPTDVRVGVYANRERTDFNYRSRLRPRSAGGVPATDFVLLTGELQGSAQLRVSIPTVSTTWFADAMVDGEGELHLPLFAGERAVTSASIAGGESDTSVLYGPGVVLAWVDAGGVQVRIEKDPDRLISRPKVVSVDAAAKNIKLASRPNPLGYGPDLYAIGWIGSDGRGHLRVTSFTQEHPIRTLAAADDLSIGVAPKGTTFGAAVATRTGDKLSIQIVDETGQPVGQALQLASKVVAIAGVDVTRDRIIVGWRGDDGSHIVALASDLSQRAKVDLDRDLFGLSLTNDRNRLLTLQRAATTLSQVTYFLTLEPTGVDTQLGPTLLSGHVSVSGCLAAWPELRDDASNRVDLRFALLDPDGHIVGESHLLNVEEAGDHLAPTTVCASETRAYATFFERAAITDPIARLRLRRIPTITP